MRTLGRIGILAALGLAVVAARADEEKVPLDKVPKAVLDAFKGKFPAAQIKGATKEEEDGQTVYEIESTLNGLGLDALLTPAGAFVEVEKEVKPADLPAAVSAALKARYPGATVEKAEEVTKKDTTVYEAHVKTAGGKGVEAVFDRDGKLLKEEEGEKD